MFKCYQSELKVEGFEFFLLEFTSCSLHLPTTPKPIQPNPEAQGLLSCVWEVLQREWDKIYTAREADRDF